MSNTNIGKAKGLCSKCNKTIYLKQFTVLADICAVCKLIDCICNVPCRRKEHFFETCVKCEEIYQKWLNEPFYKGQSRREFYDLVSSTTCKPC